MKIDGLNAIKTPYTLFMQKKFEKDRAKEESSGFAGFISSQSGGRVLCDIPEGEGGIVIVGKKEKELAK